MLRKMKALGCIVSLVMLAGCLGGKRAADFQTMTLDYALIGGLSSPNPEIKLANVPPETAFLKVSMKDRQRPNFNHGNETIAYDGSGRVPKGALRSYRGPEPPPGESHSYEITVEALNADKSLILGEGSLAKNFP